MTICCVGCFDDAGILELITRGADSDYGVCDYCEGTEGPFADVDVLTDAVVRVVMDWYDEFDLASELAVIYPDVVGKPLADLLDADFGVFSGAVLDKRELLHDILIESLDMWPGGYGRDSLWTPKTSSWLHWSLDRYWSVLRPAILRHGHSLRVAGGGFGGEKIVRDAHEGVSRELHASAVEVPTRTRLWRARRGRQDASLMGAPPPDRATSGRGNLQGQPVLYACGEPRTAISEVRPSMADEVTLARLKLRRPVRVCDLRPLFVYASPFGDDSQYLRFLSVDGRNRGKRVLGHELGRPIRRDEEERDYLPSQFLVSMLRNLGFDGVAYASAQRSRSARSLVQPTNYLFFDPVIADVVDASSIFTIASIHYSLTAAPTSPATA